MSRISEQKNKRMADEDDDGMYDDGGAVEDQGNHDALDFEPSPR